MSIPSQVLENGHYVTRMLDPYQVLAQNRSLIEDVQEATAEPATVPVRGILTQNLVDSPRLKWILTAKLRRLETTDVVLVTEDAVEVREAFQDFPLARLCRKNDFDSPIKNAAVLGRGWPHPSSDLDVTDRIKFESSGHSVNSMTDAESDLVTHRDRHLHEPLQMIVLVLESAQIVFLSLDDEFRDRPRLFASTKQLPTSCVKLHQIGSLIAIDPESVCFTPRHYFAKVIRSRALALAAQEKYFYLYGLISKETNDRAYRNPPSIPILSERLFKVDGVILNMEFLYPDDADHHHVILLLVVSKNKRSRLVWYEWDIRVDLRSAEINPTSIGLSEENAVPSLLIPLKAYNAFMLVGHSTTTIYKNLLTGDPQQYMIQLQTPQEAGDHHSFTDHSLWVRWARPIRYRSSRTSSTRIWRADDNLYLCREDGLVLFLDIRNSLGHMVESHHSAGRLGVRIDNAFAAIDLGEHAVDLLVAGGESGDGGVWQFSPRENAHKVQQLTNWSPLLNLTYVPDAFDKQTLSEASVETDAEVNGEFFACTATSKSGSVNQLSFGNMAISLDVIHMQQSIDSPLMDAWTAFVADHTSYLFLTYPISTLLIRLEEGREPEPLDSHENFALDDRTILVESFRLGRICQVTRHAVMLSDHFDQEASRTICKLEVNQDSEILMACTDHIKGTPCVTTLSSQQDRFIIETYVLDERSGFSKHQTPLGFHPTSIAMHSSPTITLLVIGDDRGSLAVFSVIDQEQKLRHELLSEWKFSAEHHVCDSVGLSLDADSIIPRQYRMVCGLRNGVVNVLNFDLRHNKISLSEQLYIGSTTVQVKRSPTSPNSLYLGCDGKLFTLEMPKLTTPWLLTTRRRVSHLDRSVEGAMDAMLAFVPPQMTQQSTNLRAHLLLTIDSTTIRFSLLDTAKFEIDPRRRRPAAEPQGPPILALHRQFSNQNLSITPHPINIRDTPSRFIYSRRLKQLIVLTTHVEFPNLRQDISNGRIVGKGTPTHAITFVSVSSPPLLDIAAKAHTDQNQIENAIDCRFNLTSKPGEKFLNLTEWFPKLDGMEYHLLLINTMMKERRKPATGRLLVYTITGPSKEAIKVDLKKALDFKSPLYAVACLWDRSSVIYGSGNELSTLRFIAESTGLKYEFPSRTTLRSPARYLTVHEPYIYVSTATQSCQIYTYRDQQLQHVHGDVIARNSICHITNSKDRTIVATDMNGGVTGFWQPPTQQANNALPTLFEANVPMAITQLHYPHRHASQRDVYVCGGNILLANDSLVASDMNSKKLIQDYRPGALVGSSNDGSIIQLVIIDKGWELLRLIQSICEDDDHICAFSKRSRLQHRTTPSPNSAYLHIDGNILRRLLTEDGADHLIRMLGKPRTETRDNGKSMASKVVEERWDRFLVLAVGVLGEGFASHVAPRENIAKEVLKWIAYLTRSAL